MIIDELNHCIGNYCRTSSLRDLLEFKGYKFSETMIFGLSSGLNFVYSSPKSINNKEKFVAITGILEDDYDSISENMRIIYYRTTIADNDKAWMAVNKQIDKENPVILTVSLKEYEPYLNTRKNNKKQNVDALTEGAKVLQKLDASVGIHATLLVGYDETKAYLYENNLYDRQTIPIEILKESRNPKSGAIRLPYNEAHIFIIPEILPDIKYMIYNSIIKTTNKMINTAVPNYGINGLHKLLIEMPNWDEMMNEDGIKLTNMLFFYFIEIASGGGLYRRLYSNFLREASEMLKDIELYNFSKDYMKLFRAWRSFAKIFVANNNNDFNSYSEQLTNSLIKIVSLEKETALRLNEYMLKMERTSRFYVI